MGDGAANLADNIAGALPFPPETTVPTNMDTVDTAVKGVTIAETVVYTAANNGSADGAVVTDMENDTTN